jgi:hypothetical protein
VNRELAVDASGQHHRHVLADPRRAELGLDRLDPAEMTDKVGIDVMLVGAPDAANR